MKKPKYPTNFMHHFDILKMSIFFLENKYLGTVTQKLSLET